VGYVLGMALAGSTRAYDAAFKQSGIIRTNIIKELLIMPGLISTAIAQRQKPKVKKKIK